MKNIFKIIRIARPLYHLVIALAILILITSAIELATPLLSKFIVDDIVAKIQSHGGNLDHLIFLIVLSFVISIVSAVITSITNRLGDHFAGRLRQFLTEKFYHKVLTLPQSYFDSEISGKIVNQLNRGIQSIYGFLNTGTNFILPIFLQSLFTIFVLAYYNIPIAFLTFILFPIYLGLSYYSTIRWGREEVLKNQLEDVSRGRMQEVIGNIKVVKSFNNEKNEHSFMSRTLTQINKIYARQSTTFHIFDFLRNGSLNLILFGVNAIVFYNTFQGQLTIGEMVLILQLVNQARRPLFAMSFILTQIQTAESGSKEFFEILSLPSVEHYTKPHTVAGFKNPSIEFKHVSFKYDKSAMVLKDASLIFRAREKVALVGHSGAGKSTIVNLILKFYAPTSGELYIDGKKYSSLSHASIRQAISLVFQENELFSSTIRDNVGYGQKATEKQIIEALKLANAWDFVKKLSKGLDSEVGERGVRLSGGQKQRIQIARALLKNAPILILDEATSSLDARSEKEVQEGLTNLMKDKLVLIIAHRFSTIQNVDKIVVVDEGSIIDSGSPQQLATKPGVYSDLLRFQIEGNKKLLEKFEIY